MARHESLTVTQLAVTNLQFKKVAVTVNAAAAAGSSAADTELEGGSIMGIIPTGNQDQFVDDVTIAANGAVTVTLAANATANNTFLVMVWRAGSSYPDA